MFKTNNFTQLKQIEILGIEIFFSQNIIFKEVNTS